jgi:hypothetical protein
LNFELLWLYITSSSVQPPEHQCAANGATDSAADPQPDSYTEKTSISTAPVAI